MRLREPIVCVLGHIDHGKTTLLDRIRRSSVAAREAGGITQHIGATEVPYDAIQQICGGLIEELGVTIKLPGLLFIDTPGHEAFANLRRRGGSVADLAVLVVDIKEGLMPQSKEALAILREAKVPFVVAANKIDVLSGWLKERGWEEQSEEVRRELYRKLYELISQLAEEGYDADLYVNIRDFRRKVAVIPTSGKTGQGVPELLLVLLGLAQQFLKDRLEVEPTSPGKGVVLEVREEVGMGTVIDVILYEGTIKCGDPIVLGGRKGVVCRRVKAILRPRALKEIRAAKPHDFEPAEEVCAAAGVRILASGLDDAIPGAPIYVGAGEELLREVERELSEVMVKEDISGVLVKADALGSLEALVGFLRRRGVPVRKAEVGKVHTSDVVEALAVGEKDKYLGVILVFGSEVLEDARRFAEEKGVRIFESRVIYQLLESYEGWVEEERKKEREALLQRISLPAKLRILRGYVFRQSKPAIVGVEVLAGTLKKGCRLLRSDGRVVGRVREIQLERKSLEAAESGQRVAIAIEDVTIGRQLKEDDVVYTYLTEEELKALEASRSLREDELLALEEIKKVVR